MGKTNIVFPAAAVKWRARHLAPAYSHAIVPQMNDRPQHMALDGVKVLDLSRVLAGPWASQLLADLGADVIKIEKPGAGDDTRGWGPPFVAAANDEPGDAAYFLCANRNKRSVAIDIAKPEGAAVVRQMAQSADILLENFKVGGLKKYGLDYKSIRTVNSRLVYCSVTGFGQTGPYASRPGYDYMIQAMGGLMSITGQPDSAPGGEPMKVGVAVADLFSGMYAAAGILAALRHAERTGEGQHVDVSLFDCQIAMLANQASNFLVSGKAPTRLGNAHPNIAPYQVYGTKDGYVVVAVGNDNQFAEFATLIGSSALVDDDRYAKNRARVANRESLNAIVEPAMRSRSTAEWLSALERAGVPAGPINNIESVFADPQCVARAMRGSAQRAGEQPVDFVPHPVKYSATPARADHAPPKLGADTERVLAEVLGLSPADISDLRRAGAIS